MTIYKTPVGDVLYALNSAASDAIVGVLGGFFSDDQIEEIMYNCVQEPVKVYHARYGMCNTNVNLSLDDAMAIVEKIARLGGKTLPFAMLDSSLPDGSRVNIVMPPVSVNGPAITIRRFRKKIMTACDFINSGTITVDACAFLWCCMDGLSYKPANILFAGGTSCGKTTLLNMFSIFISGRSRIVTIEDTPELKILSSNLVSLETSTEPDVDMDMLLRNALRMRPDRIIVGEVRGPECRTMFTAMNTGHDGCIGTIHANTARETVERVVNPPMEVPSVMLKALDLIVMEQRVNLGGGKISRRITEISEVGGFEGGVPRLNTIYTFDQNKRCLRRTGVPSKIRTKISESSGMSPREFDEVLARRIAVLENLVRERPDALGFKKAVEREGGGFGG